MISDRKKQLLLFLGILALCVQTLDAQITPQEAIQLMNKGINLGNTLEPPTETGWNNPRAEAYYFDMYKAAGFNTVRVPVRWDEHTATASPYLIDESWLNRVEEVLDWGLEQDLWIVVNAHHDDWIKDNYQDPAQRARFDSIWAQVSRRFAGKSEKLVFEILNEPHGLTKAQNDEMHGRVLSIIRRTNPTRLVIFQGHNWGGSDELIEAAIPVDDYLIGSFHSYDPYTFGLLGQGKWGNSGDLWALNNKFSQVKSWSDEHQIPVFLGEFGAIKYTKDENDIRTGESTDYNSRMKHYQAYVELAQKNGFAYCAWDDGGDFRILERQMGAWHEVKDILTHGSSRSPSNVKVSLHQDTILLLSWSNRVLDNDRILIQRRNDRSRFQTIDTLDADSATYYDPGLIQGRYYYYRVIADYDSLEDAYSAPVYRYLPTYVPKVRIPYLGYPHAIPGVIEAEDFDSGGENFSYHDTDGVNIAGDYRSDVGVDIYDRLGDGFHIGNALPGEWYEYTVEVEKADTFQVIVHTAAPMEGGQFQIKVGEVLSPVLTAPNSYNWLLTDTTTALMVLEAGEQIMRFSVLADPLFNIDKIEFTNPGRDTVSTSLPTSAEAELAVKAYQGPGNQLVIQTGPRIPESLQIFDLSGRLLYSESPRSRSISIPVSHLSKGICIIHVRSGKDLIRKKVGLY